MASHQAHPTILIPKSFPPMGIGIDMLIPMPSVFEKLLIIYDQQKIQVKTFIKFVDIIFF